MTAFVAATTAFGVRFGPAWAACAVTFCLAACSTWRYPRTLTQNVTFWHAVVFFGFWFLLSLVMFVGIVRDSDGQGLIANAGVALTCIAGPFTGGIARGFQSCCVEVGWDLLPYCGLGFGVAWLAHSSIPSTRTAADVFRLLLWCVALLDWFAGTVLSLGHAYS